MHFIFNFSFSFFLLLSWALIFLVRLFCFRFYFFPCFRLFSMCSIVRLNLAFDTDFEKTLSNQLPKKDQNHEFILKSETFILKLSIIFTVDIYEICMHIFDSSIVVFPFNRNAEHSSGNGWTKQATTYFSFIFTLFTLMKECIFFMDLGHWNSKKLCDYIQLTQHFYRISMIHAFLSRKVA